jgi:ABC-type dipeptide/oligopeptide/nickel transport system permease subunit
MTSPNLQAAPSAGRRALNRFLSNRMAVAGGVVLLGVLAAALLAPVLAPHDPNSVDIAAIRQAPSMAHLLGTDDAGRDVLARLLYGARVSLTVGLGASAIAVLIGTGLGALAGLAGGWVDACLMRFVDIVLSFPALVVIMAVAGLLGPSMTLLILSIGLFEWPTAARVVRSVTLVTRELEYVQAARAAGARQWWLLTRHVVPAAFVPVMVVGTLGVASAVLLEAGLSFLGLGIQPPDASWGNMLNAAQSLSIIQGMPWLWLPPGIAVAVTVLAVNLCGDGLRDAMDPRLGSAK